MRTVAKLNIFENEVVFIQYDESRINEDKPFIYKYNPYYNIWELVPNYSQEAK